MKKLFVILVAMLFIFTACGKEVDNSIEPSANSVTVSVVCETNDAKDMERFWRIVDNANPVEGKPINPQGSLVFKFTLNKADGTTRIFAMNGGVLIEYKDDKILQYYTLNPEDDDYRFVKSFCSNFLNIE